jgi:hypothetical protein
LKLKSSHLSHLLVPDADVRLARRIRRDTVERGRDVDSVLEQVSLCFRFWGKICHQGSPILVSALMCEYKTKNYSSLWVFVKY